MQGKKDKQNSKGLMKRLTEEVGFFFIFLMAVEDDSLMSLGNLFHSFGPAIEKDLEPADREGLCSQRRVNQNEYSLTPI